MASKKDAEALRKSQIIAALPRLNEDDGSGHYQKVRDYVDELRKSAAEGGIAINSVAMADEWTRQREEKERLEAELSAVQVKLDAYERLMDQAFASDGDRETIHLLETGLIVDKRPEPYAQLRDNDAFLAWCKANGFERQLRLPWQTLNAINKDRLYTGKPSPDGVTTFSKVKFVRRKMTANQIAIARDAQLQSRTVQGVNAATFDNLD